MSSYSLVSVNDTNLEEYLRLFRALFPKDSHTTDPAKVVGYERWLVCDQAGAFGICGIYGLRQYPGDIWMDWYALAPERRGEGLGKAILNEMLAKAAARGASRFLIWTTVMELEGTRLAQFYKASGFTQTAWPQLAYNNSPVFTFDKLLGGQPCCELSKLQSEDWLH
ncbi:MAG: GNAT family N-acetyltransferase [Alphaproteobacteria bacterium]|nr:GNAT family N-acetyltransferase [Alphaproteobacteria bacterium]